MPRDEVRNDRTGSRPLECLADAKEERDHEDVPERDRLGQREHPEQRDAGSAQDAGGDQHLPPLEAVGDDAADEHEGDDRDRLRHTDHGQGGRRVPQVEDLPGDRDEEEAVADERNGPADPEQRKVALAEWAENAEPVDHAGASASACSSPGSLPPWRSARA